MKIVEEIVIAVYAIWYMKDVKVSIQNIILAAAITISVGVAVHNEVGNDRQIVYTHHTVQAGETAWTILANQSNIANINDAIFEMGKVNKNIGTINVGDTLLVPIIK